MHKPLGVLLEGSDEDDDSDDDPAFTATKLASMSTHIFTSSIICNAAHINIEDYPQAFSHYSHVHSRRKHLVCDLQGVLVEPRGIVDHVPVFELTDPVVHCASHHRPDQRHKFGRTDHGRKGINNFYLTQECNALCSLLSLPNDSQH